jgi:hypothetical protein
LVSSPKFGLFYTNQGNNNNENQENADEYNNDPIYDETDSNINMYI